MTHDSGNGDGPLEGRSREGRTDPGIEADERRIRLRHEEERNVWMVGRGTRQIPLRWSHQMLIEDGGLTTSCHNVGRHCDDETDDSKAKRDDDVQSSFLSLVGGSSDDESHDRGEDEGRSAEKQGVGVVVAQGGGTER